MAEEEREGDKMDEGERCLERRRVDDSREETDWGAAKSSNRALLQLTRCLRSIILGIASLLSRSLARLQDS